MNHVNLVRKRKNDCNVMNDVNWTVYLLMVGLEQVAASSSSDCTLLN